MKRILKDESAPRTLLRSKLEWALSPVVEIFLVEAVPLDEQVVSFLEQAQRCQVL